MRESQNNDVNGNYERPPSSKDKKKGGPVNIFKVALHKFRNKKRVINKSALSDSTNTAFTNIMGSVGALYLQSSVGGMSPPPPPPPPLPTQPAQSPDRYAASSTTPSRSSSRSSSQYGGATSSKYASALSLYDLDTHEDDDEDKDEDEDVTTNEGDSYYDGLEGDELIDAKAEVFIAKFYQQMRLQN